LAIYRKCLIDFVYWPCCGYTGDKEVKVVSLAVGYIRMCVHTSEYILGISIL
jgi:hypothetical protein